MKPLLLIADDWEGRIATSPCWLRLAATIDIHFLKGPIEDAGDRILAQTDFLMALRERTALTRELFVKMAGGRCSQVAPLPGGGWVFLAWAVMGPR